MGRRLLPYPRPHEKARSALVGAILMSAACGTSHASGPADSDHPDVGPPERVSGELVADCPSSPPVTGGSCELPALACEYGDDWSPRCNVLAQCWRGGTLDRTWQVREPSGDACPTPTSLSIGCPATPSTGSCSASDAMVLCVYDSARCVCFPFSSVGEPPTYTWQCQSAPESGCPATRPRIGSRCSVDGQSCTYAVCSYGGGTYCSDGVWTEAIVPNFCSGGMG